MNTRYLVVFPLLVLAACGGEDGPECGNGLLEPNEQCDDGNVANGDGCSSACQTPLATVKWEFNKDAAPMFTGDSCIELGVSRVEVTIDGPGGPQVAEESCSFRQVVFGAIEPGSYSVSVRPLDLDGELLTTAPIESSFILGSDNLELMVIVPFEAWAASMTGTFFFRLSWAGADCGDALPPVVEQRVRLERAGAPLPVTTEDGQPLDGTATRSCYSMAEQFAQTATEVAWGPATLTVQGYDAVGEVQFEETFDTFVGAGKSNPIYEYDVDSLNPSEPDAGLADAGAGDGG